MKQVPDPRDEKVVRCRYTGEHSDDFCTGEAADPQGEILLCLKHLGRAMELIERRKRELLRGRPGNQRRPS
jgi:hypothetical protein